MIGLATSSYYYRPRVSSAEKVRQDADLRDRIENIQVEFPGYGYRRIYKHLLRQGICVNSKRIRRIQHEYGLFAITFRSFKVATTDSRHKFPVYSNLIKDTCVTGINQVWVADITYIRIRNAFVYLAAILDIFSRRVVGWALSRRLDRQLCLNALEVALESRQPPLGCIHHSDRGVQYASGDYVKRLTKAGMAVSMSSKGNPYDNAYIESFIKTLKYEEVHLWNYETYEEVIERLPYFIEELYNKRRLHSSIGYLPPEEFEWNMEKTDIADRPVLNL